jgi:predicted MFS family arabinose efflux permease
MSSRNSGRAWGMFVILMLCGVSIGLSQFKVTPVMALLAEDLGVSTTSAAWLTSIFTLAGIVLSIPGAGIISKAGPKRTLLFMLCMLIAGSLLGAVAPTFELMLASRVVEGVAAIFALPVGVEFIGRWFEGSEVGAATGIFMTATPIATFVMTSCGLQVVNALGSVRSLWWITFAYALVCLVLAAAFLSEPAPNGADLEPMGEASRGIGPALKVALSSKPLVLLCGAMFFLVVCLYSLITCYPQLFVYYGLSTETSNLLTSLNGLVGIPMSVISGIIIGKTGKPHKVALVGAVGTFAVVATLPLLGEGTYALNVIGSAIFPGGIVMAPMFCLAPVLVGRLEHAAMGTCLINTFFYLGQLVSTPLITALSNNNTDWVTPSIVLSVSCVIFFALTLASERAYKATWGTDAARPQDAQAA